MTEVTGVTTAQIDQAGDDYAHLLEQGLDATTRRLAADWLGDRATEETLATFIRGYWTDRVEQELAPTLALLLHTGAAGVRSQLRTALTASAASTTCPRCYGDGALQEVDADYRPVHTEDPCSVCGGDGLVAAAVRMADIPPVPAHLVDAYLATATNRLQGAGDLLWEAARDQLREGVAAGESHARLAQRIRKATGLALPRAKVIARNEAREALIAGADNQVRATGLTGTKRWVAVRRSTRTRLSHRHAHGQEVDLRDTFTVGGVPLDRPHDPTGPPEETIGCFPGETLVRSPSSIRRVYRRWYEGVMVRVNTASGVQLAGTPNHPVLTPTGWQPLEHLNVGAKLVKAPVADRVGGGKPEVDDMPTPLAEIYRAAAEAWLPQRVRGSRVDFHGDGADGEIEVVSVDGDLPFPLREPVMDDFLVRLNGYEPTVLCPSGGEDLVRPPNWEVRREAVLLTDCLMRRSGKPEAILERCRGHTGIHRCAASPSFHASVHESPPDDTPVDAITSRESRLGLTSQVAVDDLGVRHAAALARPSAYPGVNSGLAEAPPDRALSDADLAADLLQSEALGMQPDEVVKVEWYPWRGHVYNLETVSGWYIGNSIICSNCRCGIAYSLDTADVLLGPAPQHAPADDRLLRQVWEGGMVRAGVTIEELARLLEDLGLTAAAPEAFHLPGKHNQKGHGHRKSAGAPGPKAVPSGGKGGGGGGGTVGGTAYDDPAAAKKFLDDHYGTWKKKDLTDAEYAGLSFYQSPGFALMNGQLRGLKRGDIKADMTFGDSDLKRAKKASGDLTKGIAKAPPLPHAVQVHRGFDAGQFGDLSPGMTVTDKGFVSTSLTSSGIASVGRAGKPGVMRIELPAGTKAGAGSARELILPPGSSFEVLGIRSEGGTTYVDARLVGGGGGD